MDRRCRQLYCTHATSHKQGSGPGQCSVDMHTQRADRIFVCRTGLDQPSLSQNSDSAPSLSAVRCGCNIPTVRLGRTRSCAHAAAQTPGSPDCTLYGRRASRRDPRVKPRGNLRTHFSGRRHHHTTESKPSFAQMASSRFGQNVRPRQ